jgi:RimJ/RimL family protein N-acetyltransferase
MSQATLHTKRIELVPLSDEHFELEVELNSDPEVMRHLGGAQTPEQAQSEHDEALADAARAPGLGYWVGFVEGAFVGYWILRAPGAIDQAAEPGEGEIGYRLLRRYWRQGLGSEGSRELIRHGFEDLRLARINALTSAANAASRATMAAVGLQFVREFVAQPSDVPPGTDLEGVEYAIAVEQWRTQR